jgi:hypothetical protein
MGPPKTRITALDQSLSSICGKTVERLDRIELPGAGQTPRAKRASEGGRNKSP